MHHILALLWFVYMNYLTGALVGASFFLLIFALTGVETGLHKKYVKLLLATFEYCRQTLEKKQELKKRRSSLVNLGLDHEDDISSSEEEDSLTTDSLTPPLTTSPSNDSLDVLGSLPHPRTPSMRRRILSVSESNEEPRDFQLGDACDFINKGMQVIIDDEVTKRFDAEEIRCWNLLTRTNKDYQFTSFRLSFYWIVGFAFRMYLLFPIRIAIFIFGMVFFLVVTSLVGLIPDGWLKRTTYHKISITAFRILSRSVSAVITYHNEQYRPTGGGICVANHTSPFDVVMLHCDNAYALVGQLHGGFLGILERALNRATSHVFFDRAEMTDRMAVTNKMKAHCNDPNKLPILIFPEGTCINNSAVMMFKKGSFEVASTVFPAAIKYDPIFGDPFWNSSKYGFFTYLLRMMTSWAIVCDVWYLPPMTRLESESPIEFASRVKAAIARQGGLVDLEWDGMLKRAEPRPELKQKVQQAFSRKISGWAPAPPSLSDILKANGDVTPDDKGHEDEGIHEEHDARASSSSGSHLSVGGDTPSFPSSPMLVHRSIPVTD